MGAGKTYGIKMTTYYTTPEGKQTKSVKVYLKEWDALKKPIEKAFDMEAIGFDPSLTMKHRNGGRAVEIPVWFAQKLVKMIEKSGENNG
jgi:hypothetical protein